MYFIDFTLMYDTDIYVEIDKNTLNTSYRFNVYLYAFYYIPNNSRQILTIFLQKKKYWYPYSISLLSAVINNFYLL